MGGKSKHCQWDVDAGYRAICVKEAGASWCIDAWTWASAVRRDPVHAKGLQLDCEATNVKLRTLYELAEDLDAPSLFRHDSTTALRKLNQVCGVAGPILEAERPISI